MPIWQGHVVFLLNSRKQVREAAALYAEFKAGNPRGLVLRNGRVERGGIAGRVAALRRLPLRAQVNGGMGAVSALLAAVTLACWQAGLPAWTQLALLACLALVLGLWSSLRRNVLAPLSEAGVFARRLAGGDLTCRIAPRRDDEMGQLVAALRQSAVNLFSVIGDVCANFDEIRHATGEIASGNLDLSGTESQASSLQETAASMEQLTRNVGHSADSVGSANALAARAATVAGDGQRRVAQVVSTMDASSAAAAKEIKTLIEASIANVDSGSRLSAAAGAAIGEVVGAVGDVTRVMGEIATATREQSGGLGQVNGAVTQLDAITQQNAALVEEAAAAAATLARQADDVAQALAVFQLEARTMRLAA